MVCTHTKYHKKTTPALNLLRSLATQKWGASKTVLLTLYKALIKSRISYGSELFHSATINNLKKLDAIQYRALKIVCKAAHSTSIQALQNECGEPPLHLQRLRILARHVTRIQMVKDNPANTVIQDTWQNYYGNFKISSVHNQLQDLLPTIATYNDKPIITNTPPWKYPPITTDTFLSTKIDKQKTNNLAAKTITLSYYEQYDKFFSIYTDASKQIDGTTGLGIYIPLTNTRIKQPLHSTYSIFEAEMAAIKVALAYINTQYELHYTNTTNSDQKNIIIYSDSLSAILAINNFSNRYLSKQIVDILDEYTKIKAQKINLIIAWVPSHVDIKGNEMADELAKAATYLSTVNLQPLITLQDIYKAIDAEILSKWQEIYTKSKAISHYKTIEQQVSFYIKFTSRNLDKESTITRLRLGNTYLNKYLFKIQRHPNGNCDYCTNCKETITHFLITCPHYNIAKNIQNPTIKSILSDQNQIDLIYLEIIKLNKHL